MADRMDLTLVTLQLRRAAILACQIRNPAVDTARWLPQLAEWLDQARVIAAREGSRCTSSQYAILERLSVLAHSFRDSPESDLLGSVAYVERCIGELLSSFEGASESSKEENGSGPEARI